MAVTAESIITRLEAETTTFEARLTAAGNAIERFSRPQVIATRATAQLSASMRSLAGQAISTTGPIGQLGASLLGVFGGPAGLALGAAIGGLVLLIRKIGKEAEDAEKATVAAMQRLQRGIDAATSKATAGTVVLLNAAIDRAEARVAALEARAGGERGFEAFDPRTGAAIGGSAAATVELQRARDVVALLRNESAEVMKRLNDAADERIRALELEQRLIGQTAEQVAFITEMERSGITEKAQRIAQLTRENELLREQSIIAEEMARIRERTALAVEALAARQAIGFAGESPAGLEGLPDVDAFLRDRLRKEAQIPVSEIRAAGLSLPTPALDAFNNRLDQARKLLAQLETPQQAYARQVELLNFGLQAGVISTLEYESAISELNKRMKEGEQRSLVLAGAIINAINAAISAASGGGIGGFIGAVGGVVSFFNPLAGVVISGVGAVTTSLEAGNDRRHRDGESAAERRHQELLGAMTTLGDAVIILAEDFNTSDPRSADRLAATLEQIEQQRILIRGRRDN